MFLVNMLGKMKSKTALGSRVAEVHNGSAHFTGDAGQGESNVRRWIIENDWLEAVIALPLDMFYNTGIATYIWVLTNRLVADCAYFEYQRNRIYVRTNKKVRRYQRRLKKRSETKATCPNKIIDHTVPVCPRCKSDDLVLDYQEGKEKYAYDLRRSRG
jgi:type I restriction-modification system DNA methylase subunit